MLRFVVLPLLLAAAPVYSQEIAWPPPGEYVAVAFKDGRQAAGVVTSETTEQLLALASTARGVTTESAFPRAKIARIEKRTPPELKLDEIPAPPLPVEEEAPPAASIPRRKPVAKITSLAVKAHLANWDNDPEPDGLLVEIAPLDATGDFVPVAGNIDLELYGERHQRSGYSFDDRPPFTLLDRSAKVVRAADAEGESYVVKLPFRRFHPDRNRELNPVALVRARFSVPGQGVFEASDDWTILQSPSRFRDDLQHLTGRRYLPQEQTKLQTPFDYRRVSP